MQQQHIFVRHLQVTVMVEHGNQEIRANSYQNDHSIMIANTHDVYKPISQYQAVTEHMKLLQDRAVYTVNLGFKLEGILQRLEVNM